MLRIMNELELMAVSGGINGQACANAQATKALECGEDSESQGCFNASVEANAACSGDGDGDGG